MFVKKKKQFWWLIKDILKKKNDIGNSIPFNILITSYFIIVSVLESKYACKTHFNIQVKIVHKAWLMMPKCNWNESQCQAPTIKKGWNENLQSIAEVTFTVRTL